MKKPKAIPLKEVAVQYRNHDDARVTVLGVHVKEPTGPCDFSYGGSQFWFSSMKKVSAHNIREKSVRILHQCPRTNLLMSMKCQEVPYKDDKGDMHWGLHPEGWSYEDNEVQKAFANWITTNVAEKFLLGDR